MSEKIPTAHPPAKADDRNLVAVDAEAGASFEDRVFLFWKNYRTSIFAAIIVAVVLIVGREAWQAYSAHREDGIRTAFGASTTTEAHEAFAREHAGHPLAGLALLYVADDAYAKADYAAAARHYGEAATSIEDPIFAGRARLGYGMSDLQSGQAARGVATLTALADDTTAHDALRAEAWYQLAAASFAEGDFAKARDSLNRLQELAPGEAWFYRAGALLARMPAEPAEQAEPAPAPVE